MTWVRCAMPVPVNRKGLPRRRVGQPEPWTACSPRSDTIQVALSGQTYGAILFAVGESFETRSGPTLTTPTACPSCSKISAFPGLTHTTLAPTSRTNPSRRFRGCDGSKPTKAPPALRVAKQVARAQADLQKQVCGSNGVLRPRVERQVIVSGEQDALRRRRVVGTSKCRPTHTQPLTSAATWRNPRCALRLFFRIEVGNAC